MPTIVTPVAADQPAWGKRVQELGVGPVPLPFKKLTAWQLADAITEAVTNIKMRERAAELGKRLQEEDGPGTTIKLFSRYVETFHLN